MVNNYTITIEKRYENFLDSEDTCSKRNVILHFARKCPHCDANEHRASCRCDCDCLANPQRADAEYGRLRARPAILFSESWTCLSFNVPWPGYMYSHADAYGRALPPREKGVPPEDHSNPAKKYPPHDTVPLSREILEFRRKI